MVEYGMIMVLIGLVVLTMLVATGHQVLSLYSNITSTLHQAGI
jgi:Flp pilus assembly pilin Flp